MTISTAAAATALGILGVMVEGGLLVAVVAANWGDVVGAVVWGLSALVDGGLPLAVRDVNSSS